MKIILVAGGTAGHINAALALGEFFNKNGWEVSYLSGTRFLDKQLLPHAKTKFLETRALRTKNPLKLGINLLLNLKTFLAMIFMFLNKKPDLLIGAGGYVCGPTLLAAFLVGKPVFILEQNAIAGLTNRILQKISKKVFTHFKNTKGIENQKVVVAGNPVRSQIRAIESSNIHSPIRILVFGGSLGATQINSAMKFIIQKGLGQKVEIVHQVGKENTFSISNANSDIEYTQLEYIDDMGREYENSDIIISRAGASTVAELRVIQKPCLLIPYPAATDNHQYFNAKELKDENIFRVEIVDQRLKEEELADEIISKIKNLITNLKDTNNRVHFIQNPNEIIFKEVVKYVRN